MAWTTQNARRQRLLDGDGAHFLFLQGAWCARRSFLVCAVVLLLAAPAFALNIYRPENKGALNTVPCLIRVTDLDGNDASSAVTHLSYNWYYELRHLDWRGEPKTLNTYFNGCFTGGVVVHLLTKPGVYRISVYTPPERQQGLGDGARVWESNDFIYDTRNKPNVIFVSPTANDNGFFDGGWHIDYRAPRFWRYTKPTLRTDTP